MMKVLRSAKMIVALILTLTITALLPLNTVAAASGIHFFENEYLSEVYVAYGKDEDDTHDDDVPFHVVPSSDGSLLKSDDERSDKIHTLSDLWLQRYK